MVLFKQKCMICKKKWVLATGRSRFIICYDCQKKDLDKPIKDPVLKKMFDIPEEFYKENGVAEFVPAINAKRESDIAAIIFHFMITKKIYKLEKVLIDRLINTSLKKVDSIFVNSPYKSIFVSILDNTELKLPDKEGKLIRLIGFYVHCERRLCKKESDIEEIKVLRLCFIGRLKDITKDLILYFSMPLLPGDIISQYKYEFGKDKDSTIDATPLLKFALNTLLYLTSEDRMITHYASIYKNRKKTKSTKKQAKIDRRLEKYSKFSYYNVGEGLHEVLVSSDKPNYSSTDDGTRRTPIPHTVGGHWLTYWKGHGDNKKPVKKWRASFSRGSFKLE